MPLTRPDPDACIDRSRQLGQLVAVIILTQPAMRQLLILGGVTVIVGRANKEQRIQ